MIFRTWQNLLLALLTSVWISAPSLAQPLASAVVQTPQVRAELVAYAPQGVQAGEPLWLGLQLTHQPEWHTYWRNPGDSGLPTQLEFNLPAGVQAGKTLWPRPHKLRAGSLTNYGFDRTVLLSTPLTVSRTFKPSAKQTLDLQVHANWLVCRLECIPQEGDFAISIPVSSSTGQHAAAFDAVLAQQPKAQPNLRTSASFEGQKLVVQVTGLPTEWQTQGNKLSIFPEIAELLQASTDQHPQATQAWLGNTWTAQIPLSAMRTEVPKHLDLLLVHENAQTNDALRQGINVSLNVTQAWPAVEQIFHAPAQPVSSVNSLTFFLALAGAFLGGLILNLMPCVLPVLAIKLLGFAQHSRQHRAHRVAGLAYTAGVVLSFLLLGSGLLALRAAGEQLGWGFQLQSPTVVSALAVLFTLIALNLFGLFEFGQVLPSRLLSFQAKHPVFDALLSGALAVAVASPCTAPFMGASLGLAMTLPTWQALLIFAVMGLGLAAPYLLASLVPAVAKLLPRPGPWMLVLRQFLALPMLATVLWLLWVLGQQTSFDMTMLAITGLALLAACIWSIRLKTRAARFLQVLLGLSLLSGSVAFVMAINNPAFVQATPEASQQPSSTTQPSTRWQTWSEAAVTQSLAQNRVVFVDFTAAWCVTCQINKKTTLTNAEVLADFERHQVVLLRADWTRRDPAITAALTALGRSGVPVYVIYAPGRAPVVLSELLSASQIHEALNETRN